MPRARVSFEALDSAIVHFLAEGCPGYDDPPGPDWFAWFDLVNPSVGAHPDDLEAFRPYRRDLERLARRPWFIDVLEGHAPRLPLIECPTHRAKHVADLEAELAALTVREAAALESARDREAQGATKNAVAATRELYRKQRAWIGDRSGSAPGSRAGRGPARRQELGEVPGRRQDDRRRSSPRREPSPPRTEDTSHATH